MKKKSFKIFLGNWENHKALKESTLVCKSFKDFCGFIKNLNSTDTKHSLYFLRGNASYRSNRTMKTVEFLIIDGDCSLSNPERAPNPKHVHRVLKKLGFSHFIYPSCSNGQKLENGLRKRKWRLIVPCKIRNNLDAIRDHTALLYRVLQDNGVEVCPVTESYVNSQAWFLSKPSSKPYHDKFYSYFKGKVWDASELKKKKGFGVYYKSERSHYPKNSHGKRVIGSFITVKQAQKNLKTGMQIHPSLVALVKKTFTNKKKLLKMIDTSKRDSTRYRNIEQEIDEMISYYK